MPDVFFEFHINVLFISQEKHIDELREIAELILISIFAEIWAGRWWSNQPILGIINRIKIALAKIKMFKNSKKTFKKS